MYFPRFFFPRLIHNYASVAPKYDTWTKLPVVKTLVEQAIKKARQNKEPLPFENTAIWYVQHSFETSLSVLDAFVALGAKPSNIGVIDKKYSRCKGMEQEITNRGINYKAGSLKKVLGGFDDSFKHDVRQGIKMFIEDLSDIKQIIAVSHGKNFLGLIPPEITQKYPIIGIEKTTSGLIESNIEELPFPVINMAGCATKTILESPIIADELVKKVTPFIPEIANKKITCGIIGYGNTGKALTHKLLSMGHKVIVHDFDHNKLKNVPTKTTTELVALLGFSDYIFGCTGQDLTKAVDIFDLCKGEKTLISCSSGDIEFLSLLQLIQGQHDGKTKNNPLNDIEYLNFAGFKIRILRGGFPINFDGISEASPPETIQITRALSVASTLYASEIFKLPDITNKAKLIKLSSSIQKTVAQEFLRCQPKGYYPTKLLNNFNNEHWISENSGGLDIVEIARRPEKKVRF